MKGKILEEQIENREESQIEENKAYTLRKENDPCCHLLNDKIVYVTLPIDF